MLALARESQSQRRPGSRCQWPRTPCFKATLYCLLRAFPVCWQMLLALPLFRIQIQRLPPLLLPPYYPSHRWLSSPSHRWLSSPKLVPQLPSMPPYSLFSRELQRGPQAQVLPLYVTQSSCANDRSLTCSDSTPPPTLLFLLWFH